MRFFGLDQRDGLVHVPGPVSLPQLSMSDIVVGTIDDARLSANVILADATQTLTNKTIDTAANDITVVIGDVTGLTAALALKLDAASYTAADVLTKLLTVDGAGSGLDADLLDGNSSAAFAAAVHNHSAAEITSGTLDAARVADTWPDSTELQVGTGDDLRLYHDATNTFIRSDTGHLFAAIATGSTPVNLDATQSLTVVSSRMSFASLDTGNFDNICYPTSYSSPTAPASGATLTSFRFRAHDSTALRTVARVTAVASQTWSAGSAYGTNLNLANTAIGATSAVVRLALVDTTAQVTANLSLTAAGNKVLIKEGSNASMGVATLVGGTVTVSNTLVTASSRIFLTIQSLGTVTTPKAIGVTARTAATSFVITSADATDTSVIAWHIIEPAP